jgi:phosphatidylserine decarboxylase
MVHQHGDEHHIPDEHRNNQKYAQLSSYLPRTDHHRRPGAWLPADHRVQHEWLSHQVEHVDKHGAKALIPVLQEFKDLIEGNTRIYMFFTQMWDEIPRKPKYAKDPTGKKQIRDYTHMLDVLNHVLTKGPEWTDAAAGVGMVGVPIVGIFDYVMGTPR